MNKIFLVVKETGQYSSYDKECITFYTTYNEAKAFIDIHKKLEPLDDDLIYRGSYSFSIEELNIGPNYEELTQKLEMAKTRRNERDKEKIIKYNALINELENKIDTATTEKMREVYKFILWYNKEKDKSFFYQKISARIRENYEAIKSYIEETNDKYVMDFIKDNGIMSKIKNYYD